MPRWNTLTVAFPVTTAIRRSGLIATSVWRVFGIVSDEIGSSSPRAMLQNQTRVSARFAACVSDTANSFETATESSPDS